MKDRSESKTPVLATAMCGITGFYAPEGLNADAARVELESMTRTLAHRGPDDSGIWLDERAGIALGFRRLAIIDLTSTGHQPMISADGRYVIAFNGEIYNYRELRGQLESQGAHFRGTSDTEVILEGTSVWGWDVILSRIVGMFAVVLWDRAIRTLILVRDRIGKKPLYYSLQNRSLFFGSELKSICACPHVAREIDRDTVAAYLRYGYVPAPYSIYRGIFKLPPGTQLVIQSDMAPKLHTYWDPLEVVERGIAQRCLRTEAEATDELETLLKDSVARRMIADVPLGALLSGGVDSSTLVALMQAEATRPTRTFTIGFEDQKYDEAEAASKVAGHLKTDHTELCVTPREAQAVIPRLPDLYDEPFADSSQIPTFLICQLARQAVTVSLSGDGGDELFGGYTRYVSADMVWRAICHSPTSVRRLGTYLTSKVSPASWDSFYAVALRALPEKWNITLPGDKVHKLSGLLLSSSPDDLYRRLVSQWNKPGELVIGGQEPRPRVLSEDLRDRISNFTERMMYMDLVTYLPDDILTKVDRASMGVGLENRSPLLDHRLLEFVWRLPLSFRVRNGQGKWLLRQVLYRYVPPALIRRPKMGFALPIGAWLRGPLREWAESLLNEKRLRREGLLNADPIRRAWASHLSGERNEQHRLWTVLMLQAWRERWAL
jgi:asparagine synthase (glutamine-hydrolysing)